MTIKPETPSRPDRRRRPWPVRLAASTATIIVVVLAAASPAWAHSRLEHTDPADGATLTAQISTVTLTFNEMVRGQFTTVVVNGPGKVSYSEGHVQVIDDDVRQKVYPLHSGGYTVAWRAISADGHPVEGQFHFTMKLAADQEPTTNPPATQAASAGGGGRSNRLWLWGGAAAVVVVIVALVLGLTRRRAVNAP
ncbi:copper resistance protein CopC [Rugosimonospora acidiphila]|uniref:Copper resistance protein CopC n=1 Tax=Rugosimonospora acidiphila TaxID=556531 RepID=A0ABP9RM70_9ACTN